MKKVIILSCSIFILTISVKAHQNMRTTNFRNLTFYSEVFADNLIGSWSYTAANAPYEYSKGNIVITKSQGAYSVAVQVNGRTYKGEDVTVKENTINFNLFIEGSYVAVALTAANDELTGSSKSDQGTIAITGKKDVLPQ